MTAIADIQDWLELHARPGMIWYLKRLSANDTLASGGHQAGPYIPKNFLFNVFPDLDRPDAENPDIWFELKIDSHGKANRIRAVWYNNRLRGGTRNEARLTGFGGRKSPLLDPDNTGALVVFAFRAGIGGGNADICHVWVCDDSAGLQAAFVEAWVGPVEPGNGRPWSVDRQYASISERSSCWLEPSEIPHSWFEAFPSTQEIVNKTLELRRDSNQSIDVRLMRRRECEFEIFRSLEQAVELPFIQQGFASLDDFLNRAQTILQRRKARSGRSLELHVKEIFIEERLAEGRDFEHQPESDTSKRPDFLFPSGAAYRNSSFPSEQLRMLAVKTTCKDRWRQIINEADRIKSKHLFTLQEGVSENQFREMTEAGVLLVVPEPLRSRYPEAIRPHLQNLESFIKDVRRLTPYEQL